MPTPRSTRAATRHKISAEKHQVVMNKTTENALQANLEQAFKANMNKQVTVAQKASLAISLFNATRESIAALGLEKTLKQLHSLEEALQPSMQNVTEEEAAADEAAGFFYATEKEAEEEALLNEMEHQERNQHQWN